MADRESIQHARNVLALLVFRGTVKWGQGVPEQEEARQAIGMLDGVLEEIDAGHSSGTIHAAAIAYYLAEREWWRLQKLPNMALAGDWVRLSLAAQQAAYDRKHELLAAVAAELGDALPWKDA
jgi:hypothetical protein